MQAPKPDPPDPFDEGAYLDAYPDVQEAVQAGAIGSGRLHYELFGRAEGRLTSRFVSRRTKLLGGIDLRRMNGIEIGPLTAPIVRKDQGAVLYVDHADTEALRRKYAMDPRIDPAAICPVDMVWGRQSLADCLGEGRKVDYVVNAHVIEHVPDLVTWLEEIHSVLKPGGTLRMAIPDRRFTFDILRHESTLAEVLAAYLQRPRAPPPHAILDHFLHYVDVDAEAVWRGEVDPAALKPLHRPAFALEIAEKSLSTGEYQDAHCWVFTPWSFASLCAELAGLGLLPFACTELYPTERSQLEFIVAMHPGGGRDACVASWRAAAANLSA